MFKRHPSLVKQVKDYLKQHILDSRLDNDRLPPETELASSLGVSRNTVRDALTQLETEGVIFRKQGAGTFINRAGAMVKTRLEEIVLYQDMIEQHGFTPTVKLLNISEQPAPDSVAKNLHLDPAAPVLLVEKLFLADDTPVIYTCTYIPPQNISRPYSPQTLKLPVYQFISQYSDHEFGYYLTEIVPVLASDILQNILQLPAGQTALVSFEEIGYNQDGNPIVQACSYFRSDMLKLRLVRHLPY